MKIILIKMSFEEDVREPDPITNMRLVDDFIEEEDTYNYLGVDLDEEEQLMDMIIRESIKPENVNPKEKKEIEERREKCKDLFKQLERTKRYVDVDDLTYRILCDFCNDSSTIVLENDVFVLFQNNLLSMVNKNKLSGDVAEFILMNTDIKLH